MRIAAQTPFYSKEQVRQHLRDAVQLVEEANVPDDLREVAFKLACDLVSRKNVVFEHASGAGVLLGPNGAQ